MFAINCEFYRGYIGIKMRTQISRPTKHGLPRNVNDHTIGMEAIFYDEPQFFTSGLCLQITSTRKRRGQTAPFIYVVSQ